MNYSKENLIKTCAINAAFETECIAAFALSIFLTGISFMVSNAVWIPISSLVALGAGLTLSYSAFRRHGDKYGNMYFQALHRSQMGQLQDQLFHLEKTKLVQHSERLLKMYWEMRLSGILFGSRQDTLADATERYFGIMTTSLNAIARLPKGSEEKYREEKKLTSLSLAYQSALISECIARTSSSNSSEFDDLISELEAIKFSNQSSNN